MKTSKWSFSIAFVVAWYSNWNRPIRITLVFTKRCRMHHDANVDFAIVVLHNAKELMKNYLMKSMERIDWNHRICKCFACLLQNPNSWTYVCGWGLLIVHHVNKLSTIRMTTYNCFEWSMAFACQQQKCTKRSYMSWMHDHIFSNLPISQSKGVHDGIRKATHCVPFFRACVFCAFIYTACVLICVLELKQIRIH